MPSLRELQADFAAHVVGGASGLAIDAIVDDAPGAAARLGIYANHYRITLIDALAATFPVVAALTGADFFRAAARLYIRALPPTVPCLFAYGESFPDWLARLPEADGLPCLADVARLEWALNAAWSAPDAPALDPAAAMTCRGDVALSLHPSCRLVTSPWPVDQIWQAHQPGSEASSVDRGSGPVHLLVHRGVDDAPGWLTLPAAGFALLSALLDGQSLAAAVSAARATDGGFDPTGLLAALLDAGLVSRITPVPD